MSNSNSTDGSYCIRIPLSKIHRVIHDPTIQNLCDQHNCHIRVVKLAENAKVQGDSGSSTSTDNEEMCYLEVRNVGSLTTCSDSLCLSTAGHREIMDTVPVELDIPESLTASTSDSTTLHVQTDSSITMTERMSRNEDKQMVDVIEFTQFSEAGTLNDVEMTESFIFLKPPIECRAPQVRHESHKTLKSTFLQPPDLMEGQAHEQNEPQRADSRKNSLINQPTEQDGIQNFQLSTKTPPVVNSPETALETLKVIEAPKRVHRKSERNFLTQSPFPSECLPYANQDVTEQGPRSMIKQQSSFLCSNLQTTTQKHFFHLKESEALQDLTASFVEFLLSYAEMKCQHQGPQISPANASKPTEVSHISRIYWKDEDDIVRSMSFYCRHCESYLDELRQCKCHDTEETSSTILHASGDQFKCIDFEFQKNASKLVEAICALASSDQPPTAPLRRNRRRIQSTTKRSTSPPTQPDVSRFSGLLWDKFLPTGEERVQCCPARGSELPTPKLVDKTSRAVNWTFLKRITRSKSLDPRNRTEVLTNQLLSKSMVS